MHISVPQRYNESGQQAKWNKVWSKVNNKVSAPPFSHCHSSDSSTASHTRSQHLSIILWFINNTLCDETKQNKTKQKQKQKQHKTKQNTTKHNKTKQNKTKQNKNKNIVYVCAETGSQGSCSTIASQSSQTSQQLQDADAAPLPDVATEEGRAQEVRRGAT
jgi:hypothetical protein